jgi:hypothetical protein
MLYICYIYMYIYVIYVIYMYIYVYMLHVLLVFRDFPPMNKVYSMLYALCTIYICATARDLGTRWPGGRYTIYSHTPILPYSHTPILPYSHTPLHPYTPIHTHTPILPCIHSYTHTLTHTHTYTHTHSHTHIHKHRCPRLSRRSPTLSSP